MQHCNKSSKSRIRSHLQRMQFMLARTRDNYKLIRDNIQWCVPYNMALGVFKYML